MYATPGTLFSYKESTALPCLAPARGYRSKKNSRRERRGHALRWMSVPKPLKRAASASAAALAATASSAARPSSCSPACSNTLLRHKFLVLQPCAGCVQLKQVAKTCTDATATQEVQKNPAVGVRRPAGFMEGSGNPVGGAHTLTRAACSSCSSALADSALPRRTSRSFMRLSRPRRSSACTCGGVRPALLGQRCYAAQPRTHSNSTAQVTTVPASQHNGTPPRTGTAAD